MISVLIASYNINVVNLIKELHLQLNKANVIFEIICLDDASKSEKNIENKKVNQLPFCSFQILKKNIGRSAIRNLLATKASYDWLLFLDADVLPTSPKFISNYLKEIENNNYSVFLGGIKYRDFDDKSLLRWRFGKKSEEVSVLIRNKDAYKYFFTANFLIEKGFFNRIKFNEDIVDYGYEDLLFSKEIEKKKVKIKHLENGVFHLGIDQNKEFIKKTKKAITNLNFLITKKLIKKQDTNISKLYFKLKPFGILSLLSLFSSFFEKVANKNSSVTFYNLFRITYLHQVIKNS
jgi:glycosyltransferase involved in cell wall biosynthesis